MAFTYQYPRPALTVDTVIFGLDVEENDLQVLLIQRGIEPFKDKWAIPGGFVKPGESVDEAAHRELVEECGVSDVFLEQLYTFGDPRRDPREHVVTVSYYALVNINDHNLRAGTDASDAAWYSVCDLPGLAFDHQRILEMALQRLQGKIRYHPLGFELLPQKFTLTQLQNLYEKILGERLDKRNFRKKVLSLGVLAGLKETQKNVKHRAARLYCFDEQAYQKLEKKGANFAI